MKGIVDKVKKGIPIYLEPYKEPKVWGIGGTGEYWYGAEPGNKSSVATVDGKSAPMRALFEAAPAEILGARVIRKFGKMLPLVKILTPKGRLSVQFHDAKNELWIVTGVKRSVAGRAPSIIIGFSPALIKKYGKNIKKGYKNVLEAYGRALNLLIDELEKDGLGGSLLKKRDVMAAASGARNKNISALLKNLKRAREQLNRFYNYYPVKAGDVIPVPQGTLHALGAGVEIIEPQIPGPTQSLEDGATYPVRYYFPGYYRNGADKKLDLDRIDEMSSRAWKAEKPVIVKSSGGVKVERLPGGFEKKGMEVRRITLRKKAVMDFDKLESFHTLVAICGGAVAHVKGKGRGKGKGYVIPKAASGGRMLLLPASSGQMTITAKTDTQLVDTFTPV